MSKITISNFSEQIVNLVKDVDNNALVCMQWLIAEEMFQRLASKDDQKHIDTQ